MSIKPIAILTLTLNEGVSGQHYSPEAAVSSGPRLEDAHCHFAYNDEEDNHS